MWAALGLTNVRTVEHFTPSSGEDMTFVGHIPDEWRAVTASPEPNTIGALSGTYVGISATAQCMCLSRTHRCIDLLEPLAATTAASITLVVGVVVCLPNVATPAPWEQVLQACRNTVA